MTRHPHVVVLDLGLPDMDGMEVIRRLRGWTQTPIIVLSARHSSQEKVQALDAGADEYVTKPFSMDELLARVRAATRRGVQSGQDAAVAPAQGRSVKASTASGLPPRRMTSS